jgi:hypothetical protein
MMLDRLPLFSGAAVLTAALVLAGCNQTSGPLATPTAGSTAMQMPAGAGCSGPIGRFRTVIENENRVGQVSPSVYKQVDAEVTRAEEACAAGRDAEAQRMLATTKVRHGYPA